MFEYVHDISVLGPVGELDRDGGRLLLDRITNLIKFEWNKIVLDLRGVDHIELNFIAGLLSLKMKETTSLSAGGIKLANLTPYTRTILRIAGVEDRFETYDSVAEAILSFESSLMQPCGIQ